MNVGETTDSPYDKLSRHGKFGIREISVAVADDAGSLGKAGMVGLGAVVMCVCVVLIVSVVGFMKRNGRGDNSVLEDDEGGEEDDDVAELAKMGWKRGYGEVRYGSVV